MTIGEVFECELNNKLNDIVAEIEVLPIYAAKFKDRMSVCIIKESVLNIINRHKSESDKRVRMSREQLKAINDFWKEYTGRELYKDADNKRT